MGRYLRKEEVGVKKKTGWCSIWMSYRLCYSGVRNQRDDSDIDWTINNYRLIIDQNMETNDLIRKSTKLQLTQ